METTLKSSKIHFVLYIPLSLIVLLLIQSCNMEDLAMQSKGDYMDGSAIFIDTNFMRTGGHYGIALYNNNPSPFIYSPVIVDSIDLSKVIQERYFTYRLFWSGSGSYFAAVVWVRDSGGIPVVLGTFGCDTCYACTSSKVIAFPNFTGANYNIGCWNDTTHALH